MNAGVEVCEYMHAHAASPTRVAVSIFACDPVTLGGSVFVEVTRHVTACNGSVEVTQRPRGGVPLMGWNCHVALTASCFALHLTAWR